MTDLVVDHPGGAGELLSQRLHFIVQVLVQRDEALTLCFCARDVITTPRFVLESGTLVVLEQERFGIKLTFEIVNLGPDPVEHAVTAPVNDQRPTFPAFGQLTRHRTGPEGRRSAQGR